MFLFVLVYGSVFYSIQYVCFIAADIAEPEVISLPGSGSYEVFWPDRLPGTRQVALAYINISFKD